MSAEDPGGHDRFGAVDEEAAAFKAPLYRSGVAVISVNGKSNLVLAQALMDELGIPAITAFDSDAGNHLRRETEGKSEEVVEAERQKSITENLRIQAYHRYEPADDFPSGRMNGRLYAWDDNLEHVLEQWTPWKPAFDAVRRELDDLKLKRPSSFRLATRRCRGELCTPLSEVLTMARGLAGS